MPATPAGSQVVLSNLSPESRNAQGACGASETNHDSKRGVGRASCRGVSVLCHCFKYRFILACPGPLNARCKKHQVYALVLSVFPSLQAMEREGKLQEIAAKAEGLSDAALLFQRKSRS